MYFFCILFGALVFIDYFCKEFMWVDYTYVSF